MTRDQFLQKYPLPWSFQETSPDGSGVLLAANDQLMLRITTDIDWAENDVDLKYRPVINNDTDERCTLLQFILDRINSTSSS